MFWIEDSVYFSTLQHIIGQHTDAAVVYNHKSLQSTKVNPKTN